jgi:lipoprotein
MCGKAETLNETFPFVCKYFVPIFNIVGACLIHKRVIDLHLINSRESVKRTDVAQFMLLLSMKREAFKGVLARFIARIEFSRRNF